MEILNEIIILIKKLKRDCGQTPILDNTPNEYRKEGYNEALDDCLGIIQNYNNN